MAVRKEKREYYFSVEGQTEQWYLERLQALMNEELSKKDAPFTVKFQVKVEKNPLSYIKRVNIRPDMTITHLCDYEKPDFTGTTNRQKQLEKIVFLMREAKKLKRINYKLGYSNLSFDLWLILHKISCNGSLSDCKKYLQSINQAYEVQFQSMDDYKKKDNFHVILEKLTLDDVHNAVRRANDIQKSNNKNGCKQIEHCGFSFYKDNPSLSIQDSIQAIFDECAKCGFPI